MSPPSLENEFTWKMDLRSQLQDIHSELQSACEKGVVMPTHPYCMFADVLSKYGYLFVEEYPLFATLMFQASLNIQLLGKGIYRGLHFNPRRFLS